VLPPYPSYPQKRVSSWAFEAHRHPGFPFSRLRAEALRRASTGMTKKSRCSINSLILLAETNLPRRDTELDPEFMFLRTISGFGIILLIGIDDPEGGENVLHISKKERESFAKT